MRIFLNIIIIMLVGLLSSTYLLNLSPIDYRGSIEIQTPVDSSVLSLKTENTDNILNPESIVITHISEKDEVLKTISQSIFTADVYENNKLILENINNLELVNISSDTTLTINKDNPLVTTLDIGQENLGLDDGTYKIVFQSNLISDPNNSTLSIDVTYDTSGSYVPAMTTAPNGTKGFTLYFTTENADTLIPVTRFLVVDKSITRMAIEQLQNGPLNSNLKTVIGDVTNCTYNNGNVVIDLPSSFTKYNSGSTGSLLAYETFVKSIFAVDRYWPIYSVSFTVDRKVVDVYFHGLADMNKIPNEKKNYLIYLTYKISDRYYLFDTQVDIQKSGISAEDTVEIKAQKLFDAYSDIELAYGKNPIPKGVILQGVTADGNNLVLDFNDTFLKSFGDKDDLKLMMVESLIYSFTTIPNIDGITITVNGNPLTNFVNDRDLSGILAPPEFINPETAQ